MGFSLVARCRPLRRLRRSAPRGSLGRWFRTLPGRRRRAGRCSLAPTGRLAFDQLVALAKDFIERVGQKRLLHLHEQIVVRAVHRVQDRVGRHQHRQIARIDGEVQRAKTVLLLSANEAKACIPLQTIRRTSRRPLTQQPLHPLPFPLCDLCGLLLHLLF
jgi:hypothetical protein